MFPHKWLQKLILLAGAEKINHVLSGGHLVNFDEAFPRRRAEKIILHQTSGQRNKNLLKRCFVTAAFCGIQKNGALKASSQCKIVKFSSQMH
jgi:hypothetical protein